MKTKTVLITITAFLIFLFAGCGISQAEYDRASAQLRDSQAQVSELQTENKDLTAQRNAAYAELIMAQAKIAEFEGQVSELKQQYELVGETPTETAENIVKRYHETHIYSEYDFFVCSDMALDVWDMLKAHGINALIQIGNVEIGAENITAANHAWVLAETTTGKYMPLETTAGYAVWDNPLYYQGWSFDNPREYKRFVALKQEYITRIELAKQMWDTFESTRQTMLEVGAKYIDLASQIEGMSKLDPLLEIKLPELVLAAKEFGEIVGRCDQLNELMSQQNQELENIVSEMKGLTG